MKIFLEKFSFKLSRSVISGIIPKTRLVLLNNLIDLVRAYRSLKNYVITNWVSFMVIGSAFLYIGQHNTMRVLNYLLMLVN